MSKIAKDETPVTKTQSRQYHNWRYSPIPVNRNRSLNTPSC